MGETLPEPVLDGDSLFTGLGNDAVDLVAVPGFPLFPGPGETIGFRGWNFLPRLSRLRPLVFLRPQQTVC